MARENDYIRQRRTTVNVQSDWNATDGDAYIKNTPTILTKTVGNTASTSSLTIDADSYFAYKVTALAAGMTINTPSGTPTDFQTLWLTIEDNGTTRALTHSGYTALSGVTLPDNTTAGKTHVIGLVYFSSLSGWYAVAADEEA